LRRQWRRILLAAALVAAGGGGFGWWRIHRLADLGAGYVAKQMCSCVFVGGRPLESCRLDVPPTMDRVQTELTADGRGVRGFVPFFAWRSALHEAQTGCTLY
jgi:hypothetical protein